MEKPKTSTVVGFAVGALVGAGLGILFAPKAGKETREDLKDWMKEKGARSKDLIARSREELGHKREQLAAALKAGRQAYAEVKNEHQKELVA